MSYLRSEERAKQILACAKGVFAKRGFHAANVSHICEAAGIGRGTLYLYFKNKRAVLEAILREALGRVTARMERQHQAPQYPRPERTTRAQALDFTARQLQELLEVLFDDNNTLRILLREAVGLDVGLERILGEIDEALIGILEKAFIEAQAAGFIRPLDARIVATLVVGGVEKLALIALRSDAPVDLAALAREAATLHGIGTLAETLKP